jgi:DNA-binding transcriptional MerR regulator
METPEKKYGIGEVQELLKKEFPDVTISKIRFLEKEGLINPERTASGYRKYSKANIKQLSYILRLQREEYLPLAVIKKKIQDLKSGKVVAGDLNIMSGQAAEPSLAGAVPVSFDLAPSKLHLAAETINELVEFGVVSVREGPEGKYFSPEDVKILNLAKEFFRYGVEPRHLRIYIQFVGRESSFIEQIIRPQLQHKDPNTRRSAIKDLENLMALSQMFSQALLRQSLSQYLPRPASLDILDEEDVEAADETSEAVGEESQTQTAAQTRSQPALETAESRGSAPATGGQVLSD